MELKLQVLASDFINNDFNNVKTDGTGCPLLRALNRAGFEGNNAHHVYWQILEDIQNKVIDMFNGDEEKQDFTFKMTYHERDTN